MGLLTERERDIMRMLKRGKTVNKIARHFEVSPTSISRSISNIRNKILNMEDELEFMMELGFHEIKNGRLVCVSRSRDPKALLDNMQNR